MDLKDPKYDILCKRDGCHEQACFIDMDTEYTCCWQCITLFEEENTFVLLKSLRSIISDINGCKQLLHLIADNAYSE